MIPHHVVHLIFTIGLFVYRFARLAVGLSTHLNATHRSHGWNFVTGSAVCGDRQRRNRMHFPVWQKTESLGSPRAAAPANEWVFVLTAAIELPAKRPTTDARESYLISYLFPLLRNFNMNACPAPISPITPQSKQQSRCTQMDRRRGKCAKLNAHHAHL